MGNLEAFAIDVTNQQPWYKPLDVLTGFVRYHTKEKRKVKQLKLKLVGEIETHITYQTRHRTKNGSTTRTHHVRDNVVVLNTETVLVTFPEEEIHAGNHAFPFTFQITNGTTAALPNSFENPHGKIKYSLKAEMERPGMFNSNDRVETLIKVCTPIDTRAPQYNTPTTYEKQTQAGCWWWKSGAVDVQVRVDRVAFNNGEQIPIYIQTTNNSKVDVKIKAHVELTGTYKAKSHVKNYTTVVPNTEMKAVVPKSEPAHQKSYTITLPANIDPSVDMASTNGYINAQYELVVDVSPASFCSDNATVRRQILISGGGIQGASYGQQQQPLQQAPVYGQPVPIYPQMSQPEMKMPVAGFPEPQYASY